MQAQKNYMQHNEQHYTQPSYPQHSASLHTQAISSKLPEPLAPPSISATMRPLCNPIQPSDKTFGSLEQPKSPQLEYADPPEDNGPPDNDSEEELLPPDNGGNPLGPPDGDDDPDGSDPGSNHSHHPWTPHRSLDIGNQFLGALQHLAQNLVALQQPLALPRVEKVIV